MSPPSLLGQVFGDIQKFIKERQKEGIVLCISSKNKMEDAKDAMQRSAVFKWDDFIIHEVSWGRKSEAIARIAKSLNIGKSSICFLDDSAFERNEVRQADQEVIVPELPKRPEHWIPFLQESGYFVQQNELTENDTKKTSMYQARRETEELRKTYNSIDEYLEKCEVRINITKTTDADLPRHRQLIKKTNQFRLKIEQDEPSLAITKLTFAVKDKFADHGQCGLIYYSSDDACITVHSWIMSCRVFTRRVEHKILAYLSDIAISKHLALSIPYEDTNKNSYLCEFMAKTVDPSQNYEPMIGKEALKELKAKLEQEARFVKLSA